MSSYLHQRYWHAQRREHRSFSAHGKRLRLWEGELGRKERTHARDFDSEPALQEELKSVVDRWLAEGFTECTGSYQETAPNLDRWRGLTQEQRLEALASRGFGFSLKDFKLSLRLWPWEAPEAFELFIASDILAKAKIPGDLLEEVISHGTPAQALAVLDALPGYVMDAAFFSRKVMMEAVCDDDSSPLLRTQWRELVWRLLDRVDDVDAAYTFHTPAWGGVEEHYTPLQRAIAMRDVGIVRKLLERGADPNRPHPQHTSPLHYLCAMRDPPIDVAAVLLHAGALLETRNGHGRTPLGVACENRHGEPIELVHCLVNHSADVLALQNEDDDQTALTLALRERHHAIAYYLLDTVETWPRTQSAIRSPLSLVNWHEHPELIPLARKMAQKGAYRPVIGVRCHPYAEGGLEVTHVTEGSGAAIAGIHVGDVIWRVNGMPVTSMEDLKAAVHATAVGAPAAMEIEREGRRSGLQVPVAAC
jgi:hypothetical protein